MEHLTIAVRRAVGQGNWYAALSLALTLPDVCARIEDPSSRGAGYKAWVDAFLSPGYTSTVGASRELHIFLNGGDAYALRCALLHQGSADIMSHDARVALSHFHFIEPPPNGNIVHCNQSGQTLILQVDLFCEDMCAAVDLWVATVARHDPDMSARMDDLMRVEVPPRHDVIL